MMKNICLHTTLQRFQKKLLKATPTSNKKLMQNYQSAKRNETKKKQKITKLKSKKYLQRERPLGFCDGRSSLRGRFGCRTLCFCALLGRVIIICLGFGFK